MGTICPFWHLISLVSNIIIGIEQGLNCGTRGWGGLGEGSGGPSSLFKFIRPPFQDSPAGPPRGRSHYSTRSQFVIQQWQTLLTNVADLSRTLLHLRLLIFLRHRLQVWIKSFLKF